MRALNAIKGFQSWHTLTQSAFPHYSNYCSNVNDSPCTVELYLGSNEAMCVKFNSNVTCNYACKKIQTFFIQGKHWPVFAASFSFFFFFFKGGMRVVFVDSTSGLHSAHRLNFGQKEETPVWQRAKSLNKQSQTMWAKVERQAASYLAWLGAGKGGSRAGLQQLCSPHL